MLRFTDIHCHLLPGIDDGARDWNDTLAMARIAVNDGIETIITTPHQCGNFAANDGETIRRLVDQTQAFLQQNGVPLQILPGADVRIESNLTQGLQSRQLVSLADRQRHVLLELPHELYFPLEPVLASLRRIGVVGILSHPERNQGILRQPRVVRSLVEGGCLMQVTAGSLMGTFGPEIQAFSESLLTDGLVHFIATDAHGPKSRRPLMARAHERASELTSDSLADDICCHYPRAVAQGDHVPCEIRPSRAKGIGRWFRRAA
ncbi:MAG: tyrosine protein phosphatase [Planctomycetota bacterium]|nr:MAG: tyrosine protein phosphatase [Planctomycetota bacterium]REJ93660.1 MAG: tyrosine protein phosphatase [Planctomycetota bacterium]REK25709.1 MAG: tyrosine protein phosphatase [Planctomycetota bacterium]REK46545.1 MAG: tyrosine protein phosphatase [Planctomycetota bacterium]